MGKNLKLRLMAVPAALSAAAGSAMAAVPAEVTTELATIKENALTVAGVVLVAIIAIYAFKFIRKGL